jgi:hypothetical protein
MLGSWYDPLTGQVVVLPSVHPPFYPAPCYQPAYDVRGQDIANHRLTHLASANQYPANFQQLGGGLENKEPSNRQHGQDQV